MNPLFEAAIEALTPIVEQRRRRSTRPLMIFNIQPGEKVHDDVTVAVTMTMSEYRAIVALHASLQSAKEA